MQSTAPMALNVGNTAFMLLCASLVMLMTPGLAFFYGGLVGRKNVLTIMTQSFVSLGWTTVLWFAFGYSMCFGPSWHGIVGDPTHYAFLKGITLNTMYTGNDAGIPLIVHVAYQMMFAIITPALITGAFANRVTFKAYFLFLTGWLIFVYFPFVHMVWSPDGILAKWGVLDFAGGIVVHNTAGLAALASILYVGKRKVVENVPHNIPLIAEFIKQATAGQRALSRGEVIAAFPVKAGQDVMLVTNGGQIIRMPVDDIRIAGRRTQGVTLFRVADGEQVVSVAALEDEGEAGSDDGQTL